MDYLPVPDNDQDTMPPQLGRQRKRDAWSRLLIVIPWVSTIFLGYLTMLLAVSRDNSCQLQGNRNLGSFSAGYSTDFVTARQHIKAEQVRFTGSPSFFENGSIFISNPDPVLYVGDPSIHPEIDENWDKMTWGRYILVTHEEALASWGENISMYWDKQRGGYVAGLDMFHTLHCLNNIRKALDPEHYGGHSHGTRSTDPKNAILHHDHCIEQLRQYIMCSGDMTPIPTKFYSALGRNYVDSDVPHTCRNFESLHSWVMERYEGANAVKPVF